MKRVYKYTAEISEVIKFELPSNSQILRIDVQDELSGNVCLWALVDIEIETKQIRKIRIAGTGHNIEQNKVSYINTFTVHNDTLWFHAFEILID